MDDDTYHGVTIAQIRRARAFDDTRTFRDWEEVWDFPKASHPIEDMPFEVRYFLSLPWHVKRRIEEL